MLHRALGKKVPRPTFQRALALRFQSVVTNLEPAAPFREPKPVENTKRKDGPKQTQKAVQNDKSRFPPLNRKLREISVQVRLSVDKADLDMSEAVDIVQEGVSYLRDIQTAEKIDNASLYSIFQPITATLIDKASAPDADLGSRSLADVLDILIENSVAHHYHFTKVAAAQLASSASDPYSAVLQTWLKWLEYTKSTSVTMGPIIRRPFNVYATREFRAFHLSNLTFFAYVVSCLKNQVEYNVKDAMKLMQYADESNLPERAQVMLSIRGFGLDGKLKEDADLFESRIRELSLKSMDPNGTFVQRRIKSAVINNNKALLAATYRQMREASVLNDLPLSEASLNAVMKASIDLHQFATVTEIFRDILASGVESPSATTWELLLKALTHTVRVKDMSQATKEATAKQVDATWATMKAARPVTARSLAVGAGCYANLGKFDKMEKLLAEHSDLPVIDSTRNNVLIGMVLNGNVAEAEKKLQEYAETEPSYTPSTHVVNGFLSYYVKVDNYTAVEKLMDYMKQKGIQEDVGTLTTVFDFFFKMHRRKGQVPDVAGLLLELSASNSDFQFNQATVTSILDALTKDGVNMEAARLIHTYFSSKYPRFRTDPGMLTTMITGELDHGLVHNAERMFESYIKNVNNDVRMWNLMVRALLPKHEDLAVSYYTRLTEQSAFKVRPNHFTYYFLLDHFKRGSNTQKVQWAIDELAKSGLTDLGSVLPRWVQELSGRYNVPEKLMAKVRPL